MDFGKKKRVGNFYVLKVNKGGVPYMKCSDIAEVWSVEFGITHSMFGVVERLVDDNADAALQNILVSWFGVCSILDAEFTMMIYEKIDEFVKKHAQQIDYTKEEGNTDVKLTENGLSEEQEGRVQEVQS